MAGTTRYTELLAGRVRPQDAAVVRERADAAGLKVSEYIRALVEDDVRRGRLVAAGIGGEVGSAS